MYFRPILRRLVFRCSTDMLIEAVCQRAPEDLARIERAIFHEVLRRNKLSMEKIESEATARKIEEARVHLYESLQLKNSPSNPSK